MHLLFLLGTALHLSLSKVKRNYEDMLRHSVSPIMTSWNRLCSVLSNLCGRHCCRVILIWLWAPDHPIGAPPDWESGTFQWEGFACFCIQAKHRRDAKCCMLDARHTQNCHYDNFYDKKHSQPVLQIDLQVLLATTKRRLVCAS